MTNNSRSTARNPVEGDHVGDATTETTPAVLSERQFAAVQATADTLAERLIDKLGPLAEGAVEAWFEDRERKDTIREKELQVTASNGRRFSWILGGAILGIVTLALTALFLNQVDFAELVLGSGLAGAAGVGLTAALRRSDHRQ